MSKVKVFLSGKISDGKDDVSPEELKLARSLFLDAQIALEELGYEVISPFNIEPIYGETWTGYMRATVEAMMSCDYIYSLKNWVDSKGAKIERAIADMIGIPVFKGCVEL